MTIKKLVFAASFFLLLAARPAYSLQYHWTAGAGTTNWFEPGNWQQNSGYPDAGDSPRLGINAAYNPPVWPHYYGTNNVASPTDGAFLMAGVMDAWFYMEDGYLLHNSWVNIGNVYPYTGHWIQTGGIFDSSPWVRQFTVAANGQGDLTISGGAIQVDNFAIIRNNPGFNDITNAWVLLSGSGRILCNTASIGIYGTSAVLTNQADALFTVTNALTIGRSEGGIGHVYQEGGTVRAGNVDVFTFGSEYVLSGGTLLAGYIDSGYSNTGGAFIFDGGTLTALGSSQRLIRRIGAVTINSGKIAYVNTAGFYERLQSGMTGDGGLTKLGEGTLVLEGTNLYTGPTVVSAGALLFGASQFLNGLTANDNTAIGTDIDQPDNQVSIASLSLGAGCTLGFNLRPGDVSPAPARIACTAVTLNGGTTLNVTSPELLPPGTYPLLDYETLSGSGSLTLGPLPCGMIATLVTNGTLLELNLVQGASAPQIATAPASQAVLQNRSVTFSVTLTECAELAAYQWVFNETNLIDGAIGDTFTIAQAQLADAGTYQVIVTNAVGSVTSLPPAVLTVVADTVPPVPLSAMRPYGQTTNIILIFDESLDQFTAQTPAYYTLSDLTTPTTVGVPDSALLLADQRTVLLTFSAPLADATLYKLAISGVTDLAANPTSGASILVQLMGVVQPVGTDRLAVIEAEDADEIVPSAVLDGNLRSWEIATDRPGYSGWAALQCLPNLGQFSNPTGPEGPAARFSVDFPATDTYPVTYYLWVRGAAASGEDDSCHATLDWEYPFPVQMPNLSQNFNRATGYGWANRSSQGGYGRAMLVVSNAGIHTVDILMREDGFYCDKIVISTDEFYDPSVLNDGLGPDIVTRSVYPGQIAFVPGSAAFTGGQFTVNLQTVAGVQNIVEYKNSLDDSSWTQLTSFTGSGAVQLITDSSPAAAGRFYRARMVIP